MLWKEVGHLGYGFAEFGGCFGMVCDSLNVFIRGDIYAYKRMQPKRQYGGLYVRRKDLRQRGA